MNIRNEITRWTPFRELDDLQDRMKSLFLRSGDGGSSPGQTLAESDWLPAVDVAEDDLEFTLTADLPDIPKDQVKITLENGLLTIQGERRHEKEEKNKTYHRIERGYGKYSRSFQVPESVDVSKIDATFADGTLTVHLPKSPEKALTPKQIEIH